MSRTAKIGIFQVVADYSWAPDKCVEHMLELAEECLKEKADVVTMPEWYQYKTGEAANVEKSKLYIDDNLERSSKLAKKYGAYVVTWDLEHTADGKVYNTSFIYGRDGSEVGRFRKVHPTSGELGYGISRGHDFPVFELDFAKVGIMICFDNKFPESAGILARNGAEIILYPLYGEWGDMAPSDLWEVCLRARAIDNGVYIVPSQLNNGIMYKTRTAYTGIVSPGGHVVKTLDEPGSHAVVEIDLEKLDEKHVNRGKNEIARFRAGMLKARNYAAYKILSQEP
ncbi:MAG: carbon-nitrogen hydrolase family protein [Oscillospiraceae bacterium]|nr:carbon-nitrogen hydrolase family protein [Oscillospiraceae bacterium]